MARTAIRKCVQCLIRFYGHTKKYVMIEGAIHRNIPESDMQPKTGMEMLSNKICLLNFKFELKYKIIESDDINCDVI